MCATFNGNPCTMIVFYSSLSNTSDKSDITTFYDEQSSLARHIAKDNVLIISGDRNSQWGKDENNKFCLQNLPNNKNGEYLEDFSLENNLSCLNNKFEKREGKE